MEAPFEALFMLNNCGIRTGAGNLRVLGSSLCPNKNKINGKLSINYTLEVYYDFLSLNTLSHIISSATSASVTNFQECY